MATQLLSSAAERSSGGIEAALPNITQQALEWEQQQWATGSVLDDEFYTAPKGSAEAAPGTVLKVEHSTDTSRYTLPPATALSRFIYQSKTLKGSLVPVSAYILWPYSPRSSSDGFQVVAWAHGTSGNYPNCAPSHSINLWEHFLAPYNLALQGYVVVATDYAGLGVGRTALDEPIVHEYLNSPSHANDVIYSVQAARAAFPELGQQFVVMGHSQGGGAAWAAAQRQVNEPVDGYLGAVAVSPVTNILAEPDPVLSLIGVCILAGIATYFPEFKPASILTPEGLQRYSLVQNMGACIATSLTLLMDVQLFQPNWTQNAFVQQYQSLIVNGGKPVAGPLLVIHGTSDPLLNITVATSAVEDTLHAFPAAQLEYIRVPGVTHAPAMTSSQRVWMDWIGDRFAGRTSAAYGIQPDLKAAMSTTAYQPELNWYLSPATIFYQTP
ncbi:hypothetical protein MMC17_004125 [Xylographa soralifera]|nr:hypothetical protein [Xylographa soralifera]